MKTKRQEEIIEQAIKLIDQKGIQGLTIKNLSKSIGISEPAIYRHFESKTDIVLSVLEILNDAAGMLSGMVETMEGTAMDKIRFIFDKMISLFLDNPSLVSVIFAEEIFKNETVLKNKIVGVMNKNEETLEKIIKSGQEKGTINKALDFHSVALIIMGSFRLLVKRWQMNNFKFSLKKEAENLMNTVEMLIGGNRDEVTT